MRLEGFGKVTGSFCWLGKKKNTVNAMREVLMNYKQDGHLPLVLKIEEII